MNQKKDNEYTESIEIEKHITVWTNGHEKILIDWADKAMCYRWLHARSHQRFAKVNTYFTIPVIIMSTLTGTANFAQDRVPEQYRGYYSMGVGFVNILAGIITTIQQFLKISELNEGHRVSAIHWDKFYRKIKVELSKPMNERQNVGDFLKNCTEEFDRLMETSPIIQKQTIKLFNFTFSGKGKKLSVQQINAFQQLKKPEICDSLESVQTSLYIPDKSDIEKTDYKKILQEVVVNISNADTEDGTILKQKLISQFIISFNTEMLRKPILNEVYSNMISDETGITKEDILLYWKCTIPTEPDIETVTNDTIMKNDNPLRKEDDIELGHL
jgi:hypothetical protein